MINPALVAFFNSVSLGGEGTVLPPSVNTFDVFLAAGQSNIDGRNPEEDAPVWLPDNGTILKVKVWNNAANQFNTFQLGLNTGADWNATTDWAFDMIFYKLYSDYHNKTIYVVKRSKGGTPLYIDPANVKGSWNVSYELFPEGLIKLSQDLETYYTNAKAFATNYGKILNVKGMLWYQGGTDVQTAGALAVYKQNLINLINKMRTLVENPTMPFLIVTQADYSLTYSVLLEQYQNEIQAELPAIYIVDAGDIALYEDRLHLTPESSIFIGTETFNTYKDI